MPVLSAGEFQAGAVIERSGIYEVFHAGHRSTHKVVLIAGDSFPRCARCGDDVRFHLLQSATEGIDDSRSHVRVYQIPHPSSSPEEDDEVA